MPSDSSDKKSAAIVRHLRTLVGQGHLEDFARHLREHGSPALLTAMREQKLLLRTETDSRSAVSVLLQELANRHLDTDAAAAYCRYVEVAQIYIVAARDLTQKIESITNQLPKLPVAELLSAAKTVLHNLLSDSTAQGAPNADSGSVAEHEKRRHDFNGSANDIIFAVLRALNEAARASLTSDTSKVGKQRRQNAVELLGDLIGVSSELNGLEWLFDSLTYGELDVSAMTVASGTEIRLEYADAERTLIRILGIRRELILRSSGQRNQRFVRDMLSAIQTELLHSAVRHYLRKLEVKGAISVDLAKSYETAELLLKQIDAEDDLLLASSDEYARVAIYYSTAMALQWFDLGAEAVRATLLKDDRRLTVPSIAFSAIKRGLGKFDSEIVATALKDLTCTLPAASFFDLIRKPFIKDGGDAARPVLGPQATWPVAVRGALIDGGKIGKDLGRIWEKFYEDSFTQSDWRVLGRGIRLKENGRTVTDVDLLVMRGDLLLVVQVKAVTGWGLSQYDHWKTRKIIESGCNQANAAIEVLQRRPEIIASISNSSVRGQIKHFAPVVLTNSNHFDGWSFVGVPVMGEVGRKAITEGMKVEYRTHTGEILHTHHFIKKEELTTESILEALRNPIERRLAPERGDTQHNKVVLGGGIFYVPEFSAGTAFDPFPPELHNKLM